MCHFWTTISLCNCAATIEFREITLDAVDASLYINGFLIITNLLSATSFYFVPPCVSPVRPPIYECVARRFERQQPAPRHWHFTCHDWEVNAVWVSYQS